MPIPRDPRLDSTLALLREGYEFIPARARRYGTDLFEARLMLQPTVCMTGAEAASVFYADGRFTRSRALPPSALTLLQDQRSVAVLDGRAHRHRKEMFLKLMAPGRFDELVELAAAEWRSAADRWGRRDVVVLHEAAQEILCRAACTWAGVPLGESGVRQRTDEFAAMIDGSGAAGPRQLRGQALRRRTERWLRRMVERARSGELDFPPGSAAHAIVWHRDEAGEVLDARVAAVELINVLRPIVAVANYVTFAGLALHEHPEAAERVRAGGTAEVEQFVNEVRRLSPFFPFVAGRVATPFEWRGHDFRPGLLVLLDLYGTNRDPRVWNDADDFRPERFDGRDDDPFAPIPQGGGDPRVTHRCPGEWITVALTAGSVRFLASEITYEVPDQDLHVDLSRMPTVPASGFVIRRVRPAG